MTEAIARGAIALVFLNENGRNASAIDFFKKQGYKSCDEKEANVEWQTAIKGNKRELSKYKLSAGARSLFWANLRRTEVKSVSATIVCSGHIDGLD
jgi:hypothetical protein